MQIQIKKLLRLLPIVLILLGLWLVYYFGINQYLSFDSLQQHRQQLLQWTEQHYLITVISYIAIYILAVTLSIPGAIFLTIAGGFLFGTVFGLIYVVISATIGATILFSIVKFAVFDWLAHKADSWIGKMRTGFQQDAFHYLLILRLVPLFPFWVVNIVPAILHVKRRTFVIATFIGIIPGSLVYVLLGNGLGYIFDAGQTPDLGIIFQSQILLPILGLALLSVIPIIYKRYKKNKNHEQQPPKS